MVRRLGCSVTVTIRSSRQELLPESGCRSCQAFCGYHNDIAGRIYYAVMPYPGERLRVTGSPLLRQFVT